jgi:hypothetical protein
MEQIEKVFPHNIGDKYFIFKEGELTSDHYSFVSACVIAQSEGAEVYNNHGDRVFPENDDNPKYVIFHREIGNDLTSAHSIEILNVGSTAYPPYKARLLRIGETLVSTLDSDRAIRRVS